MLKNMTGTDLQGVKEQEMRSCLYPLSLSPLILPLVLLFKAPRVHPLGQKKPHPRLCSSRARWPVAPNCCSQGTRKSQLFHRNHMLGTLNFTSSEHWARFNFFRAHPCTPLFEKSRGREPRWFGQPRAGWVIRKERS